MSSPEGGYRHLAWKAARWKVLTEATPEFGFWDSGLWTSGSCRLLLRTAGHQKISEASKTHTRRLIKARPPSRPPALNEERVRTLDSVILNGTPETPGRISGHWNRSLWTPERPPEVKSGAMSGLRTPDSGVCHGSFERPRVRAAAGRGVAAPADVGAGSIRHAARRRGSSCQGAAGCPFRSRHRARGGSHRRTAAAAPPLARRACDSAAGRAAVPARHAQTQLQGAGGAANAWRHCAFRVRARLAARRPTRATKTSTCSPRPMGPAFRSERVSLA